MSDYNTIRLRQIARIKLMQGKELTPAEEFALTDYVPSKLNDENNKCKEKQRRGTRPKKLDGFGELIDELRASGMSKAAIARKLKVSTTNVCDNLKRRGKV